MRFFANFSRYPTACLILRWFLSVFVLALAIALIHQDTYRQRHWVANETQ
ncbi:hypothetical protein HPSD74_0633 [Glaesserella parasuis D74]|nr:hypothetical protein HPSD74_0633 [Glaesserella parasuis D74]